MELWSIPACAGEPDRRVTLFHDTTVYPRVCGGTFSRAAVVAAVTGLSPRVRGNRLETYSAAGVYGSIPACAGEPRQPALVRAMRRVYPRVCGGTPSEGCPLGWRRGLSPRVRGNHSGRPHPWRYLRSIPACAGEPSPLSLVTSTTTVYPRVCGGTCSVSAASSSNDGLSPRVRGNRSPPMRCPVIGGSIPACAGEPQTPNPAGRPAQVYPRVCGEPHLARPRWAEPAVYPRVCGGTPSRLMKNVDAYRRGGWSVKQPNDIRHIIGLSWSLWCRTDKCVGAFRRAALSPE